MLTIDYVNIEKQRNSVARHLIIYSNIFKNNPEFITHLCNFVVCQEDIEVIVGFKECREEKAFGL